MLDKYHMRFPLASQLMQLGEIPEYTESIEVIDLDLRSLIDNHDAINLIINKNLDKCDYQTLLEISDWMYRCYKQISHPILSNRILNSFRHSLSMANIKREYV